ncbi:hypothetical protein FJ970_16340 [Mesorhizobium sp. B2-1-8]|uniref:hypothetical protein n=2 Tax=unclassified Mesorhizobium TaxID=325217 RepID=UPI001D108E6E|nr:hypothetical protein [Mesorhizobium sp. B2-1-8]UCI16746.1 hypothetical protein FJ970_16340 [Mesorhizobium sp. B2-1-8]
MKREAEIRHRSEEVDDNVLGDVVMALHRRVKISHDFDIPYIAGYSIDRRTVYIDRHLPRTMPWKGQRVRLSPFLLTHEIIEKALLDELRLHYLHAHQIALCAERDAVMAAGVRWQRYQSLMKLNEKPIDQEKLRKVPPDLDLTPYRDLQDSPCLIGWSKPRAPRISRSLRTSRGGSGKIAAERRHIGAHNDTCDKSRSQSAQDLSLIRQKRAAAACRLPRGRCGLSLDSEWRFASNPQFV